MMSVDETPMEQQTPTKLNRKQRKRGRVCNDGSQNKSTDKYKMPRLEGNSTVGDSIEPARASCFPLFVLVGTRAISCDCFCSFDRSSIMRSGIITVVKMMLVPVGFHCLELGIQDFYIQNKHVLVC
jgi:hypothetical protein